MTFCVFETRDQALVCTVCGRRVTVVGEPRRLFAVCKIKSTQYHGPGTEMRKALGCGCGCQGLFRDMDNWGPQTCAERIDTIVERLAADEKVQPLREDAARRMVLLAIERAEA
jgi:hypothetical protein